jgi:FkbM family methyltransferase
MDRSNEIAMITFQIQSALRLNYGSFFEELPEQRMSVRYLTGKERVLEIGGNIGRNSLIIACLLNRQENLVTLESNLEIAAQLKENRDANQLHFHVETSALSKRALIQKGWDTLPSETLQEGFSWVNTMTFDEIQTKYQIVFDTLVLDCEGAFYYILMDMPEILANINLIIMENDYTDITRKQYVDEVLTQNGFNRDYAEGGGWGPCSDYFFEVWKK